MLPKNNPSTKDKLILSLLSVIILLAVCAYFLKNSYVTMAFNFTVIFAGTWMFFEYVRAIATSLKSKSWEKVPYQVVETKLSFQMMTGHENGNSQYIPFFKIEYSLGGVAHTRTSKDDLNLFVTPAFHNEKMARKYLKDVENFCYGKAVYVNPSNPKIAYLRTGLTRDQIGMLAFSVLLVLLPTITMLGIIEWH